MALFRILRVFEYTRSPIIRIVLTYAYGKILGGFTDVIGIAPRIQNFVYITRTEPLGIGSLTPNISPILKDEKTNLISKLLQ